MTRLSKPEQDQEPRQRETEAKTRPRPKGREASPFMSPEVDLPRPLIRVLQRYPCLQRHPHPFVVHFPIVFTLAAAFFSLLYLLAGGNSFETTAFHCLGAALLTTLLSMLSGELSRRVNYPREPEHTFQIERRYSRALLAASGVAFLWRWLDPSILQNFGGASLVYLALVLSLPVFATIISYFGGLLTFPLEKEEN